MKFSLGILGAKFDAIIALGSINFNSLEDIRVRLANCNKLLAKGGKMFFRVNPGIQHKHGPWVEVFEWSFEVAHNFAKEFGLELETFKQDANDRKYFVFLKNRFFLFSIQLGGEPK